MTLHTFGDSHCLYAWDKIKIDGLNIERHHIGSVTCASFGLKKLSLLDIKQSNVNENDLVCFCFGEIDCRCHICKPNNLIKYKEIINDIVFHYFEAIKVNVEQYENIITMVFNIVPTKRILSYTKGNEEFPRTGTDDERKTVTKYMNEKLREYCEKYNYIFFDVYDKYCDFNGFLSKEFSSRKTMEDGDIHIRDEKFLTEFLLNNVYENV